LAAPFWFDPNNIKVDFFNGLFYKRQYNSWKAPPGQIKKFEGFKDFEYLYVPLLNKIFFERDADVTLVEAFNTNKKCAEQRPKSNVLLKSRSAVMEFGNETC